MSNCTSFALRILVFCKGRKGGREGGREKGKCFKNISWRGISQIRQKELHRCKSIPPSAKLVTARWLWLSLFVIKISSHQFFSMYTRSGFDPWWCCVSWGLAVIVIRERGYDRLAISPEQFRSQFLTSRIRKKHIIACKWIARALKKLEDLEDRHRQGNKERKR